jgi:hypothetical protein
VSGRSGATPQSSDGHLGYGTLKGLHNDLLRPSEMRIEPEISGASIVVVGHLNPQIFQPFWLAHYGLISEEAADAANVNFINPEITVLGIEGDFNIQVERNRFSIDRGVAPLIRIADLVCKIFGELLPHTPVRQLGINRLMHFDVGSTDARDAIGLKLAPREPWGEWGRLVSGGEGDKHGGLMSLTMTQFNCPDRSAGWVQAKVEPSRVIARGRSGIYMEINDHYDLGKDQEGAQKAAEIVREKFDSSIANADSIIDQIMSLNP